MAPASAQTYRPDSRFEVGYLEALRRLVEEVWRLRSQVAVTFLRDFRAAYAGTWLGVFWNVTLPLLSIGVYTLLALRNVLPPFEGMPIAAAITLGVTLWFFFVGCVQIPISVVQSQNTEAMKTSIPLSVSIVAGFGRLAFDTLLRFALVLVLLIAAGTTPSLMAPVAIGIVFIGTLFFLALGLLAAIVNVVVPDVQRVIGVVLQYGIFLSGVIFPLSAFGPLAALEAFNPFAVIIGSSRDIFFLGTVAHPASLAACLIAGLVLTLFSARVFFVMEKRIRGVV